jgi:hypothetical protein
MRGVAVVTGLVVAAMTAATLIVHSSRERTEALEQARAQHEELVRHLERIEQMILIVRNRDTTLAADQPHVSTGALSASPEQSAAADATPEKRAAREEGLRAGNAIVDQAIADGLWGVSDFAALGAATRELSGEERAQIMERLAVAINADRVRLDQSRRAP